MYVNIQCEGYMQLLSDLLASLMQVSPIALCCCSPGWISQLLMLWAAWKSGDFCKNRILQCSESQAPLALPFRSAGCRITFQQPAWSCECPEAAEYSDLSIALTCHCHHICHWTSSIPAPVRASGPHLISSMTTIMSSSGLPGAVSAENLRGEMSALANLEAGTPLHDHERSGCAPRAILDSVHNLKTCHHPQMSRLFISFACISQSFLAGQPKLLSRRSQD